MSSQRLQKILAQAGIASRRAAERLITEGRVRVNGRIVRELGSRANPARDRVEVDGKRLVAERLVYYLLHKPRGVVTTLDDPEGRKTVKDLLRDVDQRVFPVGRLDFQTSGALLLTNDGALAQALLHPTRAVPKIYNAKLEGKLEEARLDLLRAGVTLDDGERTAPADVKVLRTDDKATSVEITISEGKNRQIHRMAEAIGRTVLRLTRIAFAGLTLEGLRPGQLRPLHPLELADLKQKYVVQKKKPRSRDMEELDETEGELGEDALAPELSSPRTWNARQATRGAGASRQDTRGPTAPRRDVRGTTGRQDAQGTTGRQGARGTKTSPRRDVLGASPQPARDVSGTRARKVDARGASPRPARDASTSRARKSGAARKAAAPRRKR